MAQNTIPDYSARLENDVLILENSKIIRTYKWNGGNIITQSLSDKEVGSVWQMNVSKPDFDFPGQSDWAEHAAFSVKVVPETAIAPEHLEAEIIYSLDKLEIKRVFRLYRDCPVIACDLYFRGEPATNDNKNIPVIEKIELPGKHWKLNAIEFSDMTDGNNTLIFDVQALSYRSKMYRGNILFAHDNLSDKGIFILKEAPASNVQLAYPGGDFITEFGKILTIGAGLNPEDLDPLEWTRGYGFATGIYSGGEINRLTALREYQKNIRIHKPGRDEMILMNTWGDRGEDKRINEKFALGELEAGAQLGITHFQLDAGWQKGHGIYFTQNGSTSNIWSRNDYWESHPERFPNGFDPVVKRGKELGIEICLWFNPSSENSNENWEKDANVLIGMYEKYGIRTFKIDGVNLPDKLAEINFRRFLEKVLLETDYKVIFNLDVTAGRRGGYHFFNEYGNIFLENRYTDIQNYYPYTSLRNLWMLSKYVPPQNLQIEFLNKWRNAANYQGDPYGPANYSFEYLFAITMAAQPLAWFEATGLPEEAFSIAPVIKKYREIQFDFHNGNIFPIGDEPSGKSWCGFQSVQKNKGYFLVFREANEEQKYSLKTWLTPGTKIKCTPVLGKGATFDSKVGTEGIVSFRLDEKNTYALYKYIVE
ncbi:MAG: alpha-galactosidase [Mangrovibacterium sp.]